MLRLVLVVLLVAVVRPAYSQDYTPKPASAAQPLFVTPAEVDTAINSRPYGAAAAPAQSEPGSSSVFFSKADHLRIAADHLEAAGRSDEAKRIRQLDIQEQSKSESAQILVNLRMFELPLNKLAEVDSARYGGAKGMSVLDWLKKLQSTGKLPGIDGVLPSLDPKLIALIEALRKDRLVWLRSEPNLIVTSGRPAYVQVGGEIGYRVKGADRKETVEHKEYGTRADVVAILLPGGRIHLDARLRVSELDPDHSVGTGKDAIPAIKGREIESGVDLRSGQTASIGGLVEQRTCPVGAKSQETNDKSGATKEVRHVTEAVEMVVLLKAELATTHNDASRSNNAARR